jgi:hypothetical protein
MFGNEKKTFSSLAPFRTFQPLKKLEFLKRTNTQHSQTF